MFLKIVHRKGLFDAIKETYFNPGAYKGRGVVDATPISFFQSFGKTIYSKRLELSVAVHSSFAKF